MFEQVVFYFFATVLVVSGALVITVRNPVHAALALVLAFFTSAAVWLLLEAEFLAIALVLVYVGAVMVLFLFVVMMLDVNLTPAPRGLHPLPAGRNRGLRRWCSRSWSSSLGGDRLDMLPVPEPHPADYSNTRELGSVLYTVYVYPFEIASVILLVAIVAAIALTLRRREGRRGQRPEDQVRVRRADRVRLVRMPAERGGRRAGGRVFGARRGGPGGGRVIPLSHYLVLGAILFCLSMAGIFLNRKNVIILLMSIELMLLAVNLNFIAFSRFLGDVGGQVFVFFILTVAAAEAAIGLAILVVLFRSRNTINVADIDTMKG